MPTETQDKQSKAIVPETIAGLIDYPPIQSKFAKLLGGQKAAAFLSSIVTAYQTNPRLRDCKPMNIITQAAVAASLDLPIISSLGFAYIIPYDGVAQFQCGWKGFVQLAQRTGEYKTISASDVYEDELDFYNPITGDFKFSDTKNWKQRESGMTAKIVGYVAYFKLHNGFEKYLYMTFGQCVAHGKRYSKAFQRNSGPWVDNQPAMCLKTVVKLLLSKWGLLSTTMNRALVVDQAVVSEDEKGQEKIEYPDATTAEAADAEAPKVETPPQAAKPELTVAERWREAGLLAKQYGIEIKDLLKEMGANKVTPQNIGDLEAMLNERIKQIAETAKG